MGEQAKPKWTPGHSARRDQHLARSRDYLLDLVESIMEHRKAAGDCRDLTCVGEEVEILLRGTRPIVVYKGLLLSALLTMTELLHPQDLPEDPLPREDPLPEVER